MSGPSDATSPLLPAAAAASLAGEASAGSQFQGAGGLALSGKKFRVKEFLIEGLLFLASASSILITVGIVAILVYEAAAFFKHVSLLDFLTDTQWTPLFENPRYGILPLLCGTLVTTAVALCVAIPVGTIAAIWLSEYSPK